VTVYPFQSTNFPLIARQQVKAMNPGQRHMFDRQIDARFAVISYGRPPSVPVVAGPICGSPIAAAPASLPQEHLTLMLVRSSSDAQRGFLLICSFVPPLS